MFPNWPVLAKKSFLEAMLPGIFGDHLERRANPEETLQAPFAYNPDRQVELGELPQNAAPLQQPHRTDREVSEWVARHVAQILAVNGQNYDPEFADISAFFDKKTLQDFKAFFVSEGLDAAMRSNKRLSVFAKESPILLNKGTVEKRHRWLFEVPVMITVMNEFASSYKDAAAMNKSYILRLQIGRVADGGGGDGMVIESWRVMKGD